MALTVIPSTSISYQALSTDISGSKITGANYIGGNVFLTDTGTWMRVNDDLTLEPLYLPTGGKILRAEKEFTNITSSSATAYSIGDAITTGSHSSALIELPNAFRGERGSAYIVAARVTTSASGLTPTFKLHFYNTSSGSFAVDNAAWVDAYEDYSKKIGNVILPSMITGNATTSTASFAFDNTLRVPVVTSNSSTSLFTGMETLTVFTPVANQKYTITLLLDNS